MCRGASTLRRAHARRRLSPPRGQVASRPGARTCRGWADIRGLPRGWPNVSRAVGAERWDGGDPSRVCAESVRKPHCGPKAATEVGPGTHLLAATRRRPTCRRLLSSGCRARIPAGGVGAMRGSAMASRTRPGHVPATGNAHGRRTVAQTDKGRGFPLECPACMRRRRHLAPGVQGTAQPGGATGSGVRHTHQAPHSPAARSLLPCVGKLPSSASMLQGERIAFRLLPPASPQPQRAGSSA
jgi:hypothetical protein